MGKEKEEKEEKRSSGMPSLSFSVLTRVVLIYKLFMSIVTLGIVNM